jgi:predicted alpha/beta superfamily hydrolase
MHRWRTILFASPPGLSELDIRVSGAVPACAMLPRLLAPRRASLLTLIILMGATGCSPAGTTPCPEAPAAPAAADGPRRWSIHDSEVIDLSSRETGRDYEIIIGLPPSFAEHPERHYPALYLTDGQWDFPLVEMLAGGLRYDKVAPEFVIVAITYAGEKPDYDRLRREDYTPTQTRAAGADAPSGGDAAKFLAFVEHGVIPLVEARYRADPKHRVLSGHSLGGLFALYALFERPELFEAVLSLSPAVDWDDRYLFSRERAFHTSHPQLDKRVWISVGDSEWPQFTQAAKDFMQQFQSSAYQGIELSARVIEGEAHAGVKPEAYNRAIRFAFQAPVEALPPKK